MKYQNNKENTSDSNNCFDDNKKQMKRQQPGLGVLRLFIQESPLFVGEFKLYLNDKRATAHKRTQGRELEEWRKMSAQDLSEESVWPV